MRRDGCNLGMGTSCATIALYAGKGLMVMTMENELDKCGRRMDCHFYSNNGRRVLCTALRDFYNVSSEKHQCGGCPFFKTDEEFRKGWIRRYTDDSVELKEVI